MDIRQVIAKAGEFVVAAWNDDTAGAEKLQAVSTELYTWLEANDHKLGASLPGIVRFIVPTLVDNPVVDKQQLAACVYATEFAYTHISALSEVYDNVVDQVEEVLEELRISLGL